VALREDAEATAAERERSRLAVLRDLEERGPAQYETLSGEVAALRLALAQTTHLLEEEQSRAQMYAEDVVEAQASCTEEKEARLTAESKLETAMLAEEEVTILRGALKQMETDSAVAQRGLYQMHDQAYEVHTVLSEERDVAYERAKVAEQEVSTLRNRISEMQSVYSQAELGLGTMKKQAVVAIEAVKAEAEQTRRELEAAAAAQVQQETERRAEAEKAAAGYREELLGVRSANEQLEATVAEATSSLKAVGVLQAKAAGLETSVAVTKQQLVTAEDHLVAAREEVAAGAAARQGIEAESARLADALREAETEVVRMQVHAEAAKQAADQQVAAAVAEAGENLSTLNFIEALPCQIHPYI
jgi:chromosome segregation ATPase